MADSVRAQTPVSDAPVVADAARSMRRQEHDAAVRAMSAAVRSAPAGHPVRLAKQTSNLFRARLGRRSPAWTSPGWPACIDVDADAPHRRCRRHVHLRGPGGGHPAARPGPLVVPQLKTITVGGAATGVGIESTSFRSGLVYDDIVEIDMLTGAGDVVTATPDGPHADLFLGFPNSYGTLGYATRLRVRLEPVRPFVALRHLRFARHPRLCRTLSDADRRRAQPRRRRRRLSRRRGVHRRRELPDPGHSHRRTAARPATTPASRSTTGRSSSGQPTG